MDRIGYGLSSLALASCAVAYGAYVLHAWLRGQYPLAWNVVLVRRAERPIAFYALMAAWTAISAFFIYAAGALSFALAEHALR